MSNDQLAKKSIDYINNNKISTSPVTLGGVFDVSGEPGLVRIVIKIGTSSYDSYATKDGKFLFPSGIDMSGKQSASQGSTAGQTADQIIAAIKKSDKPMLEAFVVSSCPFGLQMQRMIADAVKNIPSLASYVTVKYIGSVSNGKISSMHDAAPGGEEATENLRQICIREEQPTKYWNYVSCYMSKASGSLPNGMPLGDSEGCLTSTGVDTAKLNTCMTNSSKGLAYAQKDFALSDKYQTSGSPTLVLNGVTTSEFTSDNQPVFGSARSSDEIKTIVCDGFNTKAGFCSTKLNTAQAATSFSATYTTASGAAANSNTNCATAQ